MKKITFMLIALLAAVVTFAIMPKTQFEELKAFDKLTAIKAQKPTLKMRGIERKSQPTRKAMRKAPAGELVTPPETAPVQTYYTVGGKFYVSSQNSWADATSYMATVNVAIEGTDMYIQGLGYWFKDAWVKGNIDGTTVTFTSGQYIGEDEDGAEYIVGSEDGETAADFVFTYDSEAGTLTAVTPYILESELAEEVSPYTYWYSPVFSLTEPEIVVPEVVVVPEGLETDEYAIVARNYKDDSDVNGVVQIGFEGTDVYMQGLCTYIPEAWVKGTLDGTTITFAYGQYFGIYGGTYEMYLNVLMGEDVVFDYDAEAGTLTAQNECFLTDNDQYYFDSYRGAVLTKVAEKAAMPANPEITALSNGNYGYYIIFNVPILDVNGDPMASSKLSYMIYTDIEGEIAPLTFTPETHSRLTENITEIPYGFTEDYDFYGNTIYLNDLYSEDWNKIGIQSIYRGGGEENATEIQWLDIKPYSKPAGNVTTFDFNAMDIATSSSDSNAGDITETLEMTQGDVTALISPKDESATTPNRFWGTKNGPQLRMYSGTLTFSVPEGKTISQIVFNFAKWNDGNTADCGTITKDLAATWTGDAQTVVFTIAANTQINSIKVTVTGGEEPEPDGFLYSFEGSMDEWTTIDADGDGYTWTLGQDPSINVHSGKGSIYSESYKSGVGALTPDNFLVSPRIKLDGSITFYACAQDGDYPTEHFAVAVSTNGNTDAADFENVKEWTMTASRADAPNNARGMFRGPKKTPGNWYEYTVDLSSYEGAMGYVAIRHFDCTDWFYLVVDDITLKTSMIEKPDFTITPAEGKYESLSDFTLTFNNYDVELTKEASAMLTNTTTETSQTTNITAEGNTLSISFPETTEPGTYTLTVAGIQTTNGDPIELSFIYVIEAAPEVVVLPEGLAETAETWYFSATASESNVRNQEVAVAIDGSDIYIQGLNVDYLPEAWVKGTIDAEAGTATFAAGQYFGAFEYEGTKYDMFLVGYDSEAEEISDVVFNYDAEAGTLTNDKWIVISAYKDQVSYYEYYQGATITREMPVAPDLVTLPEGVEAEPWTIDGTFSDSNGGTPVTRATEAAIDGTDIYVKGIPFYFEEGWMKGTIDAESGIATFPTGQFVGEDEYGWEFMVGSNDGQTICDIEFTYDAEAKTLTQVTNYIVENGDTPDEIAPYGWWSDMIIYAGEPVVIEPVTAPEGLVTETYNFTASCLENGKEEATDYNYQMEVGFDGQDVYFKGVSDDTKDMWLKGTLSEDHKTVTIPANQYMGEATVLWYTFNYYFTAVAEDMQTMEDIVLNYNAENSTFTTDQTLVLHDGKRSLGEPYQTFTNVVITKIVEVAAVPADPEIESAVLDPEANYQKIKFNIPAKDTEGNDLLKSKLYYQIFIIQDEEILPLTILAEQYEKLDEDMTEIPYTYDDNWDIYEGGSAVYLNQGAEEIATWTNIGVQSIYYGGGERNVSNCIWMNTEDPVFTGINKVNDANSQKAVYYDLQGRAVKGSQKGLLIKQVLTAEGMKTMKVVRK